MTGLHDPARFAALVAPVIDRVVISVHLAARDRIEALRRLHRIEGPIGSLVELRLPLLAGQRVSRQAFAAVARYVPEAQRAAEIDAQVGAGRVRVEPDGALIATEAARVLLGDVVDAFERTAQDQWAARATELAGVHALVAVARAAAPAVSGPAGALMAAAPVRGGIALQLWSALSVLRYRRADAHAAAGAAEGLDPLALAALGPGDRRERVEAATNRAAAWMWEPLSPAQRLDLLAGLGAL